MGRSARATSWAEAGTADRMAAAASARRRCFMPPCWPLTLQSQSGLSRGRAVKRKGPGCVLQPGPYLVCLGPYLIVGRVENWWNGGGLDRVHSNVVAPSPQGLSGAFLPAASDQMRLMKKIPMAAMVTM